jgi:hypothetical protein
VQRTIQRVSRAAQVHFANRRATTVDLGNRTATLRNTVPKNARRKSGLGKAINPARNRGKNPH